MERFWQIPSPMRVSIHHSCLGVLLSLSAAMYGCGGSDAVSSTQTSGAMTSARGAGTAEVTEYRHRNHGGVLRLIAVSLQELDLRPDQRATLEGLRADLLAKLEPERTAGTELADVLADGVATGAVDDARAQLAEAKLRDATARFRLATTEDLDRLHATLTPAQRTALIANMQTLWAEWQHQWQEAGSKPPEPPTDDMAILSRKLGLTPEQVGRIEVRFHRSMEGVVAEYYPRDAVARAETFGAAFETPGFEAQNTEPPSDLAPPRMFGATRMTRFFEAFAPELTPAQRATLAQTIREHAARHDQP
jgi:hypothetical protein